MQSADAAACHKYHPCGAKPPRQARSYTMTNEQSSTFLRRALMLDAAASGTTGLLMIAGAGLVEGLLGLPAALLRGAGLALVPYVAFVVYAAGRDAISRPAVWTIIAANILWAAASALLLASGWIAPTALGYAFVIAQAAVVALLGEIQYVGLCRSPDRPMAAA
jgi:hypothetical protein